MGNSLVCGNRDLFENTIISQMFNHQLVNFNASLLLTDVVGL